MKFDVVVGNPPYQEDNVGRNRSDAIYPLFYDLAKTLSPVYCLVTPARFLFGIGSTSAAWNKSMLLDEHLNVLYFDQDSSNLFTNTDIQGGIVVLYRDINVNFGPIDTFTMSTELSSILSKVRRITCDYLCDIISNTNGYRYTKNLYLDYPRFIDMEKGGGKQSITSNTFSKFSEIYADKPNNDIDYIGIYGRDANSRCVMFVKKEYVVTGDALFNWKVFVPSANGSSSIGGVSPTAVIGEPVVGKPGIGHTQTFISVGNFGTKFEAEALLSYLKGKFSRAMLAIKKVTQNNKTKETWSTVPLQDFTVDSDIDWTKSIAEIDQQLYAKYDLSDDEIAFIEEKVKPMT